MRNRKIDRQGTKQKPLPGLLLCTMIARRIRKSGHRPLRQLRAPSASLARWARAYPALGRCRGVVRALLQKPRTSARPPLIVIAALRPPCRAFVDLLAPLRFALYFGRPGIRVALAETLVLRPGCGRLPPNKAATKERYNKPLPLAFLKPS